MPPDIEDILSGLPDVVRDDPHFKPWLRENPDEYKLAQERAITCNHENYTRDYICFEATPPNTLDYKNNSVINFARIRYQSLSHVYDQDGSLFSCTSESEGRYYFNVSILGGCESTDACTVCIMRNSRAVATLAWPAGSAGGYNAQIITNCQHQDKIYVRATTTDTLHVFDEIESQQTHFKGFLLRPNVFGEDSVIQSKTLDFNVLQVK